MIQNEDITPNRRTFSCHCCSLSSQTSPPRYLLNLHTQPCEHISSIPCGTTPTHLFWLHKIIYLEYTFHFGLKTPICIQAKSHFVFKPNWMLYSSQIESCNQAKLKVVFKPNCLVLYGNASKRWFHTCFCDDESLVLALTKHMYFRRLTIIAIQDLPSQVALWAS